MNVGYARTSTLDQSFGLEAQIEHLQREGCERIFQEQVSSAGKRPVFHKAVEFIREGDALVVCRLDRLARSVSDLWSVIEQIEQKGATLRILNLSLDTGTATGKLMLSTLGAVAEFERDIMLERQRDGIAKARAAGKRFGRKPTARAKQTTIQQMRRSGTGVGEIAKTLSISRASVYRYCLASAD